jgi:L-threonylcarbamoyladenylate synthase
MVPDALTGGRDSVAVRCPDHPVALSLLDAVGPLAAPSANRFGALSPTTAEAVLGSLPGVPVLDGGPCRVGLESTIVDLTGPVAAILRPGALTAAELGLPLGPPGSTPAPGTLPQHYAPRTPVLVVDAAPEVGPGVAVVRRLAPPAYARSLYATLRELDNKGFSTIIVEKAEPEGIGLAVNDRLLRMAHVSKRNGPT